MNATTVVTSASNVFTSLERHHIDSLAAALSHRLGTDIRAEYGETDEGHEWAALSADLELLVTIAAGAGTAGGHVVIDASGRRRLGSSKGTLDAERLMKSVSKAAEAAYLRATAEPA
jgi:hypothetical protein